MQPILHTLGLHIGTILRQGEEAAGDTPPAPKGMLDSILFPVVAIFAIFYFVLIRPERKKQAERKETLSSIKKGTKVMTTSGMFGTVAQMQDDVVTLQVADGVRLRFNRAAIQDVLDAKESQTKDAGGKDTDEKGTGEKGAGEKGPSEKDGDVEEKSKKTVKAS